jgi:rare lipoprotein A
MRRRIALLGLLVVLVYGCASTSAPEPIPDILRGVASWYGEEFAGRTTANGEIFDPSLLTAAHRTLPFGTVLDIVNPKTSQSVRVRVNDRGPYIGNRVIDLSYAAAQRIGLIEPGIGEVEIKVVRIGSGDREPPAPLDITLAEEPKTAPIRSAGDPPPVAFPLPSQAGTTREAVVESVEVQTQRGDVMTRKQVGADGRSLEDVPVGRGEAPSASAYDEQRRAAARKQRTAAKQFVVQAGAFAVETNAKLLQARLTELGHRAFIDREDLYRVRIGPFTAREQAEEVRDALEASGMSALIVTE